MSARGTKSKPMIGLFVRAQSDAADCAAALRTIGRIRTLESLADFEERLDVDLLLMEVDAKDAGPTVALMRFRKANPGVPIMLVGRGLDPDLAVEYVKVIGEDFCSLPLTNAAELGRKAQRVLTGGDALAMERPCFTPLTASRDGHMERRRAYRAIVPAHFESYAHVLDVGPATLVTIDDISISDEGFPGGLLLKADRATAQEIVKAVGSWGKGTRLSLAVRLEGRDDEIPLSVRVVRIPPPKGGKWFNFAIEYHTRIRAHEQALRKFWADCQKFSRSTPGSA